VRNKVVVGGAIVIVAVVLGAAVLAFAVPEDHEVSRSATYTRSADEVFDVITAFADLASWRRDVDNVTTAPGGRYTEHGPSGELAFQVLDSRRPRRLEAEVVGSQELGGIWTYELSADGGGTRLTLTERGTFHDPLTRVTSHYLGRRRGVLDRYLIDLGTHLGEDVTPR
jgi:hypothetical protein